MAEFPSITCPQCGMTSYNPNDIREGYCGNCHDWTSPPKRGDAMSDKIEVYQDKKGEYRWTRYAANHEIVGQSSEGYVDKDDLRANIDRTQGGEFTVIDSTIREG